MGREQEWNISEAELEEMVEAGVLSEEVHTSKYIYILPSRQSALDFPLHWAAYTRLNIASPVNRYAYGGTKLSSTINVVFPFLCVCVLCFVKKKMSGRGRMCGHPLQPLARGVQAGRGAP